MFQRADSMYDSAQYESACSLNTGAMRGLGTLVYQLSQLNYADISNRSYKLRRQHT
jgi:hypothetical protein